MESHPQNPEFRKNPENFTHTRHVSCLLNKFEFRFLRLHMNKTNKFCFFVHNGRVFGIAK